MISIKSINKSYGKKQVLFDLNYEFGDGVYGLLGPNGAGKSTLLQIMTENLRCDSGKVFYNGKDIQKNSKLYRHDLGYVPQLQGMYEMFSAFEFLSYMASLKGIKKQNIFREVERVLTIVGLWEEASRKLSTYSGGMKQRVLIAQALLGDPKVLVMDEPTAGLDPKERIRIRNFISKIAVNKTVIIATHVVSDVDSIAKEVLLLGNGRIQKHGTIVELCDSLKGRVYECRVKNRDLEMIESFTVISNIQELSEGEILVRLIGKEEDVKKINSNYMEVVPNLQEVYLFAFSKKDERE